MHSSPRMADPDGSSTLVQTPGTEALIANFAMVPWHLHHSSQNPGTQLRLPAGSNVKLSATAVNIADLSQPWLSGLIKDNLNGYERAALFRTCRALAEAVARHSPNITLKPLRMLNGPRRAFVFNLAACSRSIHWWAKNVALGMPGRGDVVPLDSLTLWPCITQLTVSGVNFNSYIAQKLNLQELVNLSALGFDHQQSNEGYYIRQLCDFHDNGVTFSGWAPQGSLPSLRTLRVTIPYHQSQFSSDGYWMIHKLGPEVCARITRLELRNASGTLQGLCSLPALRELQVDDDVAPEHLAHRQVFNHPSLKHVSLPIPQWFDFASCENRLQVLQYTGTMLPRFLATVPVSPALHLILNGAVNPGITYEESILEAAINNLSHCGRVELKAKYNWGWFGFSSPSPFGVMPMLTLHAKCPLTSWLLQKNQQLQVAICLARPEVRAIRVQDLGHLKLLPVGVHQLCLCTWSLCDGCTWGHVIAQVPSHVYHLVLKSCGICNPELQSILSQQTPTGLKKLTIFDPPEYKPRRSMPDDAGSLRCLAAAHWPKVRVEIRHHGYRV